MAFIFYSTDSLHQDIFETTAILLRSNRTAIHLVPMQSEKDMLFTNPKLKLTPEEFKEIAEKINKEIA